MIIACLHSFLQRWRDLAAIYALPEMLDSEENVWVNQDSWRAVSYVFYIRKTACKTPLKAEQRGRN